MACAQPSSRTALVILLAECKRGQRRMIAFFRCLYNLLFLYMLFHPWAINDKVYSVQCTSSTTVDCCTGVPVHNFRSHFTSAPTLFQGSPRCAAIWWLLFLTQSVLGDICAFKIGRLPRIDIYWIADKRRESEKKAISWVHQTIIYCPSLLVALLPFCTKCSGSRLWSVRFLFCQFYKNNCPFQANSWYIDTHRWWHN